jgi:hypothetical protein
LIVEGAEDANFWRAVLPNRRDLLIEQTEGNRQLTRKLAALVVTPGFRENVRWLGVMQDADTDPQAAFDRIRTALMRASLPVPKRSWETTTTEPAVIAFVLPDEGSSGDLETLLWRGLSSHPAASCVDNYVGCLRAENLMPRQESKTRVYTFLASLDRPDLRLAHAVLAQVVGGPDLQRILDLIPPRP